MGLFYFGSGLSLSAARGTRTTQQDTRKRDNNINNRYVCGRWKSDQTLQYFVLNGAVLGEQWGVWDKRSILR